MPKKTDKGTKEPQKKEPKKRAKKKREEIPLVEAEIVETPVRGGVGGNGNLIPFDQRTEEEQREIRRAGGIASGESRRKKKDLREFTRDFLMQMAVPVLQNNMKILGVEDEEMTNLGAMVTRLFSKAVNNGDLNAARTIIEWAGMAPLQQEKENEAIARMSQVMQLASGASETQEGVEDVIFYVPDNGRSAVAIETATTTDN